MADLKYSKLGGSSTTFQKMIQRFGVITVMNARVYKCPESLDGWANKQAPEIIKELTGTGTEPSASFICKLDTLKIANITEEGPDKTVTGGQYNNPLIKFGKSARLEMQDALGNAAAIDALCGGIAEASGTGSNLAFDPETVGAIHFGEDFEGPKSIVGDTFFIDQKTGQQVQANIIFYQFLPDSIFNLTQDAEGDATVFDMNGDLLATTIAIGDTSGKKMKHGVFYSIVDPVGSGAATD